MSNYYESQMYEFGFVQETGVSNLSELIRQF